MPVIWSDDAEADLDRIFAFNVSRTVAWAARVERRIGERAESLALVPASGRPTNGSNLRLLSIPEIQYVITYRIDPDGVTILKVESTRERA